MSKNEHRLTNHEAGLRILKMYLTLEKSLYPVPIHELESDLEVKNLTIREYVKNINKYFSTQKGEDLIKREGTWDKGSLYLADNSSVEVTLKSAISVLMGLKHLEPMTGSQLKEGIDRTNKFVKDNLNINEISTLKEFEKKIIYSDFGVIDYSHKNNIINCILEALYKNYKIQIIYNSKPFRTIRPYTLFFHLGTLYLHAFCENSDFVKTFKILNIDKAELMIDENTKDFVNFNYPRKYNFQKKFDYIFGLRDAEDKKEEIIEIKFNKELYDYISSKRWHRTQSISKVENDHFTMKLKVKVSFELKAWVLQFGSDAEVIGPQQLIEDVRHELIRTLKYY